MIYTEKQIQLRCKYPTYTRVELAHLNQAAYAWLSKFERIWLESYLPSKVLDKNPMKKVRKVTIKKI